MAEESGLIKSQVIGVKGVSFADTFVQDALPDVRRCLVDEEIEKGIRKSVITRSMIGLIKKRVLIRRWIEGVRRLEN